MTGRRLLRLIADGRLTFVLAGATLGIGAYGFAVTLRPYESDRVFEPIPSLSVPLARVAITGPIQLDPPDEGVVDAATPAPQPPGDYLVAVPRPQAPPAPIANPAPVQAAGDDGGVTPLQPVETPTPTPTPTPRSIGPIIIEPVETILPVYPPRSRDGEATPTPDTDSGDSGEQEPSRDPSKPGGKVNTKSSNKSSGKSSR